MDPDPDSGTLSDLLGITGYEHPEDGIARARLPVTGSVLQPYGIVHGGAYSALAETVVSRATWEVVRPEKLAMGQSNDTAFLRPVTEGEIKAESRALHAGRTTWIWDTEMRDDEGRLCAISRTTIAVRPAPPDPAVSDRTDS
ncbi:MAG TPA: PaaI family thioesterase [Solirubrobacterales bacterium]|nr:PaaI family thioesterase [Solirubrobacterales bacterium]